MFLDCVGSGSQTSSSALPIILFIAHHLHYSTKGPAKAFYTEHGKKFDVRSPHSGIFDVRSPHSGIFDASMHGFHDFLLLALLDPVADIIP